MSPLNYTGTLEGSYGVTIYHILNRSPLLFLLFSLQTNCIIKQPMILDYNNFSFSTLIYNLKITSHNCNNMNYLQKTTGDCHCSPLTAALNLYGDAPLFVRAFANWREVSNHTTLSRSPFSTMSTTTAISKRNFLSSTRFDE